MANRSSRRRVSASEERQVVPAAQVREQPGRHGRAAPNPPRSSCRAPAPARRRVDDARVEAVAGDREAARRQHRACVAGRTRADAHQREVAGAAAEVGDQHQLLVIQPRGVARAAATGSNSKVTSAKPASASAARMRPRRARRRPRRRRPSSAPGAPRRRGAGHPHRPPREPAQELRRSAPRASGLAQILRAREHGAGQVVLIDCTRRPSPSVSA